MTYTNDVQMGQSFARKEVFDEKESTTESTILPKLNIMSGGGCSGNLRKCRIADKHPEQCVVSRVFADSVAEQVQKQLKELHLLHVAVGLQTIMNIS